MLITEEYRALNRQLHEERASFGSKGSQWATHVQQVALQLNTTSILDYGCGKGTLAAAVPLPIREYDPAIPGKDAPPEPADIVVCCDVLEHVEPEYVGSVLDDLQRLALRVGFFTVHCGPAAKFLPDGRNAHVSQHPVPWWFEQFNRRFVIAQSQLLGPYTLWLLARSQTEHEKIVRNALEAAGVKA